VGCVMFVNFFIVEKGPYLFVECVLKSDRCIAVHLEPHNQSILDFVLLQRSLRYFLCNLYNPLTRESHSVFFFLVPKFLRFFLVPKSLHGNSSAKKDAEFLAVHINTRLALLARLQVLVSC